MLYMQKSLEIKIEWFTRVHTVCSVTRVLRTRHVLDWRVVGGERAWLLTEEERFLQSEAITSESPLLCESKKYMTFLEECTDDDPLEFWTRNDQRFPILASVTRRVLPVSVTSASAEQLFFASGRVWTFDRSSLKPINVDMLTCSPPTNEASSNRVPKKSLH